ncbi:MAG: SGNH/GDSL hydrolase family protein [Rhodospirillales bacterium]|jgi:lysophospholipase L1-like esterase|nr:SGNH/GDSL hydrolase family protein [Rhodospirillales bacterium]MBT3907044.1 SGNH/GDSL hydrolase family protein [Rhodospirillaceae bacterium]MBT5035060.1 SGNH/GDSL hydrolase family protein [Rhodospirillaceae bacterium]MBT6221283.1 SGNH/GDSL hydrolase family protein [Rhodospirillaceae bacterium]MBT6364250.1 SGNH/GDSL hydrolase family protein [Rhodospirillaceae bacterium]
MNGWEQVFWESWRSVWAVLGLIVVFVVFIEFGIPLIKKTSRRLRGKSANTLDSSSNADFFRDKDWAHTYFTEYQKEAKVVWAPFVQWWQHPMNLTYFKINEDGIRNTDAGNSINLSGKPIRIFAFGGSTLLGVGSRDEMTIPSILARKLQALGKNVEITNFGQPGHSSTQEVISLIQALKKHSVPDLALYYDGINEIIPAEQTGQADRMFNEHNRREEFNILHFSRRNELIEEGIKALIPRTLRRLKEIGLVFALIKPKLKEYTLLREEDIEPLSIKIVEQYRDNVRIIDAIAKDWGFETLFFWQPSLVSKKSLTEHEEKYQYEGTAKPNLRRPIFSTVYQTRKSDSFFTDRSNTIDISGVLDDVEEGCYIDPFHVSEDANEMIADAMLPFVEKAIEGK